MDNEIISQNNNKYDNALIAIQRTKEKYEQMREELELAKKEKKLFYMHMKNLDERNTNKKVLSINEYKEYKKLRGK